MAITLERPAFYENKRYAEYCGLSTDNKEDIKANNADEFYEIDTGDVYKYAEGSGWIKQASQGGGGSSGDFKADGTVPMTGNLNMNGKSIIGVHSISNTNTGLAIESEASLNNHKITDLLDPTADQDAATKKYVDDHSLLGDDGLIDADLNMNEHAIINAHKISTDGPAPLYIGATIEASGTNAPRLTGATDGTAAFVKADTQSEYVAVSVGAPTAKTHAANKDYVDGYAMSKAGGTMTGNLYISPDGTSSIIFAPMGTGAAIQFKDSDESYTNITVDTGSASIRLSSGASSEPIVLRGIATPQIDSDAVNMKFITDNYVPLVGSSFTFPGVTMIENVATPGTALQAANKNYVDTAINGAMDIIDGSVTDIHVAGNGSINGQIQLTMPSWFVQGTSKASLSISTTVDWTLCSITSETWSTTDDGAVTVTARYLLFNTSSNEATADVKISCVAIK